MENYINIFNYRRKVDIKQIALNKGEFFELLQVSLVCALNNSIVIFSKCIHPSHMISVLQERQR